MLGLRFLFFSFIALFGVVMSAPTPAYACSDYWRLQEYKNKVAKENKEREEQNPQQPLERPKTPPRPLTPPPRPHQPPLDQLLIIKKPQEQKGSCTIM